MKKEPTSKFGDDVITISINGTQDLHENLLCSYWKSKLSNQIKIATDPLCINAMRQWWPLFVIQLIGYATDDASYPEDDTLLVCDMEFWSRINLSITWCMITIPAAHTPFPGTHIPEDRNTWTCSSLQLNPNNFAVHLLILFVVHLSCSYH